MLPPEPDAPPEPVRRRGRAASLVVALLLFAAFWAFSAGMAAWGVAHEPRDRGGAVAALVFWTAMFALLLWRVWRGGPLATAFLARIGTMIGIVFLGGVVAFAVLMVTTGSGGSPAYLLPCLLAGTALVAGGRLLGRGRR